MTQSVFNTNINNVYLSNINPECSIFCAVPFFAGFFMYIETSKPRQLGDVAILQSKPFLPSGERCLQFYYHMYGDHIGTLRVLYSSDGIDTQIWERKQEQGNQWLLARVNLPSTGGSPYTVCHCFH